MLIAKLYRQHNACVITVPQLVCEQLEIKAGEYVGLDLDELSREVTMFKIHGRISNERRNQVNPDQPDTGGDS